MTSSSSVMGCCPACSSPVEPDGVCLACFFTEATQARDLSAVHQVGADARSFARVGRLDLPCEIAGYRLEREIARGGMGMVYEAEDLRLRRKVALKMVLLAVFASAADMARFRAEAELAGQLSHPNIVPIYDVGEVNGTPFFTMRLIHGISLSTKLARDEGRIPPREAVALMIKVARAVQHAHERGVLHRDLTPGNILLDEQGEPHLTDFGLAKLLDADLGLTRSEAHIGTPYYMSPEQAAGRARDITTASDVWALGVLLQQLLTRSLPFAGDSSIEVMQKIITAEPAVPDALRKEADLATIVRRCLEKEPSRRPVSAAFLADELERWLRGETIFLRRIGVVERVWKWMGRHRAAAAAIWVLSFGALVGIGVWVWHDVVAGQIREERKRQMHDAELLTKLMSGAVEGLSWEKGAPLPDYDAAFRKLVEELDASPTDALRKMELLTVLSSRLTSHDAASALERALAAGRVALEPEDDRLWMLRADIVRRKHAAQGRGSDAALRSEAAEIHRWMSARFGPQDTRTEEMNILKRGRDAEAHVR